MRGRCARRRLWRRSTVVREAPAAPSLTIATLLPPMPGWSWPLASSPAMQWTGPSSTDAAASSIPSASASTENDSPRLATSAASSETSSGPQPGTQAANVLSEGPFPRTSGLRVNQNGSLAISGDVESIEPPASWPNRAAMEQLLNHYPFGSMLKFAQSLPGRASAAACNDHIPL
jgi:hypothetical protein